MMFNLVTVQKVEMLILMARVLVMPDAAFVCFASKISYLAPYFFYFSSSLKNGSYWLS